MKNLKIINGINAGILAILAGAAWFLLVKSPPETLSTRIVMYTLFGVIAIAYLGYVIKVNKDYLESQEEDPLMELESADTRALFRKEVTILKKSIMSVEFYRDKFAGEEVPGGIKEAYDLLSDKAYENVAQATKWMQHYDYITNPSRRYLQDLVSSTEMVTQKINELDELMLRVHDSVTDVDTTYVDDLLASLREVSKSGK